MISAEAHQSWSRGYNVVNLTVDFQDQKRHVLIGDHTTTVFQGIVKLR
jgi:hypothetical protein